MKYLLYPITWLFLIIVFIRNKLYDWKVFPAYNSQIPIISIGNIQLGGAGKTPFVIALCKQLISQNIKPLIITRGYKRNTKHQIILDNIKQHSVLLKNENICFLSKNFFEQPSEIIFRS